MRLRSLLSLPLSLSFFLVGCPTDVEPVPVDVDGDGWPSEVDCDDEDAALNLDDADGDGVSTCDPIPDCDDADPALNHDDADGDGATTCDAEPDCNDADPALNPEDADGDGVSTCAAMPDCDDADAAKVPGGPEDVTDSVDNDCDSVIDEVQILYLVSSATTDHLELSTLAVAMASNCLQLREVVAADDPVAMAAVDSGLFGAVLVEHRTDAGADGWAGDAGVVFDWGIPTLAMGKGGAALFFQVGVGLAWGNTDDTPSAGMVVNDEAHPFFNTPYRTLDAVDPSTVFMAGSALPTWGVLGATGDVLATSASAPSYALLAQDSNSAFEHLWYLGFGALGSQYDTAGLQTIANMLLSLGGRSDCSP